MKEGVRLFILCQLQLVVPMTDVLHSQSTFQYGELMLSRVFTILNKGMICLVQTPAKIRPTTFCILNEREVENGEN